MAITDPSGARGYSEGVPSREELIEKTEDRLLRLGCGMLQWAVPEARSLGAAWKAIQAERDTLR